MSPLYKVGDTTPVQAGTIESIVQDIGVGQAFSQYRRNNVLVAGSESYCAPCPAIIGTTNAAPAIDTLFTIPFYSGKGGILNRMAFVVTVAGTAGSVCRMGLYDSDQVTVYPTGLLLDGGQQDGTAATLKESIVNFTLVPGRLYWFVYHAGVAAPQIRVATPVEPIFGISYGSGLFNSPLNQWNAARTFSLGLPATFPAGAVKSTSVSQPLIGYTLG